MLAYLILLFIMTTQSVRLSNIYIMFYFSTKPFSNECIKFLSTCIYIKIHKNPSVCIVCLFVCPIFSPPSRSPILNLFTFLESLHHGSANKIICSLLKVVIKKKLACKLFSQVKMCSSM